jgi:hypothetical protein
LESLVAYSAKHGEIAADGPPGGHSPYARALLDNLDKGLSILKLLGNVRNAVVESTRNELTGWKQEPYIYGSLGGRDYLLGNPNPSRLDQSSQTDDLKRDP